MKTKANEWNFDGLVGPTHNYAGLSLGNVASLKNAQQISYPKQAALQGLAKMKSLADRGFKQGVLAPQLRPDLAMLKRLGFSGSPAELLGEAAGVAPEVLAACYSASSMWTANAATISPSADTPDAKLHFTPANLVSKFHRSLEHQVTGRILQAIFPDEKYFRHHLALPSVPHLGDEGAANHTRFCEQYGERGLELFVYGHRAFDEGASRPRRFPARQSLEASQAVARLHGLSDREAVFAQQNPEVIDAGVFHNDVISVGNRNCFFTHEKAFLEPELLFKELKAKYPGSEELDIVVVPNAKVRVLDAVESYLFNSQLLSKEVGSMLLVCPEECRTNASVHSYLKELTSSGGPIDEVIYLDVKQSMQNGGGPACLRLRVVLTEEEEEAINPRAVLTEALYSDLCAWVNKHYREELSAKDLVGVALLQESYSALKELQEIMNLGSVYPFEPI